MVVQPKGNRFLTLSLAGTAGTVPICQADSLRAYLRGQMPEAQVAHAQSPSGPVMDIIGHIISMHTFSYIFIIYIYIFIIYLYSIYINIVI